MGDHHMVVGAVVRLWRQQQQLCNQVLCQLPHDSVTVVTLERGWSISPTGKGPVHIPNWKGANPYPQLERGHSISPTRKGPLHIPNREGATPYPQPGRGHSISPTGKGPVHIPNWEGASPYPQLERGHSISPTRKGPVHIPNRGSRSPRVWGGVRACLCTCVLCGCVCGVHGSLALVHRGGLRACVLVGCVRLWPIHTPNRKGDSPYPQPERGHAKSVD